MTFSRDFRELKVWQKAHQITLTSYKLTRAFPKEELYGLTSQIRRASASVCANIAEGCGRKGEADFSRFLQIALGSSSELEYHLILAQDLRLLDPESHKSLQSELTTLKRMLVAFITKLRPPAKSQEPRAKS